LLEVVLLVVAAELALVVFVLLVVAAAFALVVFVLLVVAAALALVVLGARVARSPGGRPGQLRKASW